MVLAIENDGMLQAVHFSGHASHSFLLLSATKPLPVVRPVWQTPLVSVATQVPLNLYFPEAQTMQSFAVEPEQVLHVASQAAQAVPFEKDPSGQTVPVFVAEVGGLHFVESVEESVKPDWQAVQVPVDAEQVEHPISHTKKL